MSEHDAHLDEVHARMRQSGSPLLQWAGLLPSGNAGIHGIEMTLELVLHVRMYAPEHLDALVAAVRELSEQNAELHAEVMAGRDEVRGFEAHEAWRACIARGQWDDLLFVLHEYGAAGDAPAP